MSDPIFGPMTREQFRALVTAPFGVALEAIRRHDPLYGRKPGEKLRWKVTLRREIPEIGTAIVIAATQEEADDLAQDLSEAQISWDVDDRAYYDDNGTIEKVEPDGSYATPNPSYDNLPLAEAEFSACRALEPKS